MNAPIKLAQATTPGAAEIRTVRLEKPADGKAVLIQLSTNQTIKVDFSGIANEKIIIVRIGERAVILFDNGATVTLDPFWDSLHRPLANLQIEVAPGQIITPVEFALKFPITIDQSILPAAGEGNDPQEAGANFSDPTIDPIFTPPPLDLLPPTEIPPVEFLRDTGPLLEDLVPVQSGEVVGGIVEEEHLVLREVRSPAQLSDGNEDEGVPGDGDPGDVDTDTAVDHNQVTITFIGNDANDNNLSDLVIGGDLPYDFTFNDVTGQPVLYAGGGAPAESKGVPIYYHRIDDKTLIGFADDDTTSGAGVFDGGINDTGDFSFGPDRIVFVVTLDEGGENGAWKLEIYDQFDHPLTDNPGTGPVEIAFEDLLFLNLTETLHLTDGTGTELDFNGEAWTVGVIDDVPIVLDCNLIENGSFELGHGLGPVDWDIYQSLTGGWTWGSDLVPFEIQTGGVGGLAAAPGNGNAFVELDGDTFGNSSHQPPQGPADPNDSNATLQQVVNTDPGQFYELSFWYAPRPGDGNADSSSFEVLWNGTVVHTIDSSTQPEGWQIITVFVEGTGGFDTLGFRASGEENELGAFIDNVSLCATWVVDEDDIDTPWSLGTSPFDGNADGSDTENNLGAVDPAIVSGSLAGMVKVGADETPEGFKIFSFSDDAIAHMQSLHLFSKQTALPENGEELFYTLETDGDFQILRAFEPDPDVLDPGLDPENPDLGDTGNPVFELRLNQVTGAFEFRLFDELIHMPPPPGGSDENFDLRSGDPLPVQESVDHLDFGDIIEFRDFDQDAVLLGHNFKIFIRDDVPEAEIKVDHLGIVQHDETPDEQPANFIEFLLDPADSDTDSASVAAQFAALEADAAISTGEDPDVPPALGAIGYARSFLPVVFSIFGTEIGADSPPLANQFSLAIADAASGLEVTDGGDITLELYNNGTPADPTDDLILGRVTDGTSAFNNQIVFAIAIDQLGRVSVAQYLSLKHPDTSDHDESIDLEGKINAILTVTDSDGDTSTDSAEIGQNIRFDDDGPEVEIEAVSGFVIHDETPLDNGDHDVAGSGVLAALFAGVANKGVDPDVPQDNGAIGYAQNTFTVGLDTDYGADGPGTTTTYGLGLSSEGVNTGLQSTEGRNIQLFTVSPNLIVGRYEVGDDNDPDAADPAAFAIHIDPSTGQITVVQYVSIKHDDVNDHDEANDNGTDANDDPAVEDNPPGAPTEPIQQAIANGALQLVVTVTDGDGDTASDSVNIGNRIRFEDDGPSITGPSAPIAVDEDDIPVIGNSDVQDGDNLADPSPLAVNGVLGGFNAGADGLKDINFASMHLDNVQTSLGANVTANDVQLRYFWDGATDTLYASTNVASAAAASASASFKIQITDPVTGAYTFTLLNAVDHPLQDDSPAAPTKIAYEDNLDINLTFTVVDKDDDFVDGTLSVNIDDDIPVVTFNSTNYITNGDFTAGTWVGPFFWGSYALPGNVPGWSIAGDPTDLPDNPPGLLFERPADGYLGLSSSTDGHMLDLGASGGNYQLSQQVGAGAAPDLVAGQKYVVEFEVGAPFPATALLEVYWGGVLIGTIDTSVASGELDKYAFIVEGTGVPATDTLLLKEIGSGNADVGNDAFGNDLLTERWHGTYVANFQILAVDAWADEDGLISPTDFSQGNHDNQLGDAVVPNVDGDNDESTTIGSLNIEWGADQYDSADGVDQDGVGGAPGLTGRSLTFTNNIVEVLGTNDLKSQGDDVTFVIDQEGTRLRGVANDGSGERTVFEVELFDDGSGSFRFQLFDQLDHAGGADENDIALKFNFTATDSDGDQAKGSFLVGVDDDVPTLVQTTSGSPVDCLEVSEEGQPEPGSSDSDELSLLVNPGADDNVIFRFKTDTTELENLNLQSGGVELFYTVNVVPGGDDTITATKGNGGPLVFTIALQEDGTVTFTLAPDADIDIVGETLHIDIFGVVQAVDFDNDPVDVPFCIIIEDGTDPLVQTATFDAMVEEEQLGNIDAPTHPASFVGNEDISASPDEDDDLGPGFFNITTHVDLADFAVAGGDGDPSFAFNTLIDNTIVQFADAPVGDVTSQGHVVRFDYIDADSLTGYADENANSTFDAGDRIIFTVEISNVTDDMTFSLWDNIDHHVTGDDVEGIRDLDFDNVVIASDPGVADLLLQGTISIIDDTPIVEVTGGQGLKGPFFLDETANPDGDGIKTEGDDIYGPGDLVHDNTGDFDDTAFDVADPSGTNPFGTWTSGPASNLFAVNKLPGADGEKSDVRTLALKLIALGGTEVTSLQTTLKATQPAPDGNPDADGGVDGDPFTPYADNTIYLFLEAGGLEITGRVGNDPAGPVAFRISLDSSDPSASLIVDQFLAIEHPDNPDTFDEELTLGIFGDTSAGAAAGIAVSMSVTLTDGDGDADSDDHDAFITNLVRFDDDGPQIVVAPQTALVATLLLDESIVTPNSTLDESGLIPAGADDQPGVTAVDGVSAIGVDTFDVSTLFSLVDPGQDGGTAAYTLIMRGERDGVGVVFPILSTDFVATQPALGGNLDSDGVGGDFTPYSAAQDNGAIFLFQINATTIEGYVGENAGIPTGPLALRITIDPNTGVLTFQQFLALHHGDINDHDDFLLGQSTTIEGVLAKLTVTDGDDDQKSIEVPVNVTIEDDGPTIDIVDGSATSVDEGGAAITGTWTHDFGTDGFDRVEFTLDNGAGTANTILIATALGYTDYTDGPPNDLRLISIGGFGVLRVWGDGDWEFEPAADVSADMTGSFTIKVTDNDGDTASDTHFITVLDSPELSQDGGFYGLVEEEELGHTGAAIASSFVGNEDNNEGPLAPANADEDVDPDFDNTTHQVGFAEGFFNVFGGDGDAEVEFESSFNGDNVMFADVPIGQVTSHGEEVKFFYVDSDTMWGFADANDDGIFDVGERQIFTWELDNSGGVPTFAFSLWEDIDHHAIADADDEENTRILDLDGIVIATDPSTPDLPLNGSIEIIDDIPVFTPTADENLNFPQALAGINRPFDADVGADGGTVKITAITDFPGITETISGDGQTVTATFTNGGAPAYTLSLNPDGTYDFQLHSPLTGATFTSVPITIPPGTPVQSVTALSLSTGGTITFDGVHFDPFSNPNDSTDEINPNGNGFGINNSTVDTDEGFIATFQGTTATTFTFDINFGGEAVNPSLVTWQAYKNGVLVASATDVAVANPVVGQIATFTIDPPGTGDFDEVRVQFENVGGGQNIVVANFITTTVVLPADLSLDVTLTATDGDGDEISDTFNITVDNTPPTAGADTIYASDDTDNVTIPIAALLANDTDLDGGTLSITAVSGLTGISGTIPVFIDTVNGNIVFDTPGIGSDDTSGNSFTYTLSDGFGGTATGTVNVNVIDTGNSSGRTFAIPAGAYAASYLDGHGGNDVFTGGTTAAPDFLFGDDDNDQLNGNGGNDVINGGAGIDTINGGSGIDTINGGTGGDTIIGGDGADLIDTGAANDNVQDVVRFDNASEYGDNVLNFDLNGSDASDDRVRFGGALNTLFDDANNNNFFNFVGTNGVASSSGTVDIGHDTFDAEVILFQAADGVAEADLGNLTVAAARMNAEFTYTASAGHDVLIVLNATNASGFSLWEYTENGTTAGIQTSGTSELKLIGVFDSNGAIATGNLDLA